MKTASALFIACILLGAVGCGRLLHGEATTYSSGYSDKVFNKVKPGMSMQEVALSLGEPLYSTTQHWSEVWSYWPGFQPLESPVAGEVAAYELFGPASHFRFGDDGRVTSVAGDYLNGHYIGHTKDQLLQKLGRPNQRVITEFKVIYFYSMPDRTGSGTYKRREVHFDAYAKVNSVVIGICYD